MFSLCQPHARAGMQQFSYCESGATFLDFPCSGITCRHKARQAQSVRSGPISPISMWVLAGHTLKDAKGMRIMHRAWVSGDATQFGEWPQPPFRQTGFFPMCGYTFATAIHPKMTLHWTQGSVLASMHT